MYILLFMNWVRHGGSTMFETKSSYCRVARLGFKRLPTTKLMLNLIRSNAFGASILPGYIMSHYSSAFAASCWYWSRPWDDLSYGNWAELQSQVSIVHDYKGVVPLIHRLRSQIKRTKRLIRSDRTKSTQKFNLDSNLHNYETWGPFHSTKIPVCNFGNYTSTMERFDFIQLYFCTVTYETSENMTLFAGNKPFYL